MSTDLLEALRRESERIEEDAEYTHKGHYVAAERWGRGRYWLGIPAAVSAALASALMFFDGSAAATKLAQVLPQFDATAVAAGTALLTTLLATLMTTLDAANRAARHNSAGADYLALRNRARIFHQIELIDAKNPERLRERLLTLDTERSHLNKSCPKVPESAYKRAKELIGAGETQHRTDMVAP